MDMFSVVICTFNREKYVKKAIESVLNNHVNGFTYEILVIDNNSTDNTKDVVESFSKAYPNKVRYFFEPMQGLSVARNRGIKEAKGNYTVFLDDDGEASQKWLQSFYHTFQTVSDIVGVGGRIIAKFPKQKPDWIKGLSLQFYGEWSQGEEAHYHPWVPGGNGAWKTESLRKIGGFNTQFGRVGNSTLLNSEESEMINRLKAEGAKFYYSPSALMYHNVIPDRISIKWQLGRHFGQGYTQGILAVSVENRYKTFSAKIGRMVFIFVYSFKQLGRAIYNTTMARNDEAIRRFFQFVHDLGTAWAMFKLLMKQD
jgi:glycosyltransferase involved in cell wall biosynthesis